MSIARRRLVGSACLATLALAAPLAAVAQAAWQPTKPIKLVVPYPPGGSSDIIARAISQPLSDALKQSVIVENRAGGGGRIGAQAVKAAPPDGSTLLLAAATQMCCSRIPTRPSAMIPSPISAPSRRSCASAR